MAKSLKSSGPSPRGKVGIKKGSMPPPHKSPGRAAGSGPTSVAPVKAKAMGKSAGNSKAVRMTGGTMTSNPQSPFIGKMQNKR